jgi:hypothetical protein
MYQVAELMHNDVIDNAVGGHYHDPVKIQITFGTATSPAAFK